MTQFYDFHARVTLAKQRPDPTTKVGAFFGALLPNGIEIEGGPGGLRVQFAIKKSGASSPNTCEITITNLAEQTRDEIAALPQVVILEAGYGADLKRLWIGDVFYVHSEQTGADVETKIQAHDGGKAYAHARVTKSFAAGATALDAIKAAASAMGLTVPRSLEAEPDIKRAFTAGVALAGKASDELSRLLAPFGLGWSIQDGTLVVLGERGIRPGEAILIDEAAGMIETPKWSTPTKPGAKSTLSIRTLLFPELAVGGLVRVKSRTANGEFKVTSVAHDGDTHGGDRLTSIECKAAA